MKVLRQDDIWRNKNKGKQVIAKPMTSFPGPILSPQELKPGSDLMQHVCERLKADIESKKASGEWIDLKVMVSDSGVCGEGEQKLVFEFKMDGCQDNEKYAICSGDTDCAFLALQTHVDNLIVYSRSGGTTSGQGSGNAAVQLYSKMELSDMREVAWIVMKTKDKTTVGGEMQLDDFFFSWKRLPNQTHKHYFEELNSRKCYEGNDGEYLTRFGKIDRNNFSNFLKRLSELEYQLIGPGKTTKQSREQDGELVWNQFRNDYYKNQNIPLQDVPFFAKNYLKVWISIFHMDTRGSSDWEGLHCPKFTPLVADMLKYCFDALSEKDMDEGWHLTPLAYNILIMSSRCFRQFSATCVDPFPLEYKKLHSTKHIKKIFG